MHVIQVDTTTPLGRPIGGVTVEYVLANGKREVLGVTGTDGIADGEIDESLIGKPITLRITGNDDRGEPISEEKQVTLNSVESAAKGVALSIVPVQAVAYTRAEVGGGEFEDWGGTTLNPCEAMVCPPSTYVCPPCEYYIPGVIYPQSCEPEIVVVPDCRLYFQMQ